MDQSILTIEESPRCIIIKVNDREVRPSREFFENVEKILRKLPLNRGYCIMTDIPWVAAYISHELHPTRFVAVYDRSTRCFIVVERHVKDVNIGELICI